MLYLCLLSIPCERRGLLEFPARLPASGADRPAAASGGSPGLLRLVHPDPPVSLSHSGHFDAGADHPLPGEGLPQAGGVGLPVPAQRGNRAPDPLGEHFRAEPRLRRGAELPRGLAAARRPHPHRGGPVDGPRPGLQERHPPQRQTGGPGGLLHDPGGRAQPGGRGHGAPPGVRRGDRPPEKDLPAARVPLGLPDPAHRVSGAHRPAVPVFHRRGACAPGPRRLFVPVPGDVALLPHPPLPGADRL